MAESEPSPVMQTLRGFTLLMLCTALLLTAGGYLYSGFDLAFGILLGSLIVIVNFLWTRWVAARAIALSRPKIRVAISFVFKLGLTFAVLLVAITKFHVNPYGIILGISTLLISSLFYIAVRRES